MQHKNEQRMSLNLINILENISLDFKSYNYKSQDDDCSKFQRTLEKINFSRFSTNELTNHSEKLREFSFHATKEDPDNKFCVMVMTCLENEKRRRSLEEQFPSIRLDVINNTEYWSGELDSLSNDEKREIEDLPDVHKKTYELKSGKRFSITKQKSSDTSEPMSYIPPSCYDVILTDLKHKDLIGDISNELYVKYLEDASDESSLQEPVNGIIWGTNYRLVSNMVISSRRHKKQKNIIFVIDTGCPGLFICEKALYKLGFTENVPSQFQVIFRNKTFNAAMSPPDSHFADINLLGGSFLGDVNGKLEVDYASKTFSVTMGRSP